MKYTGVYRNLLTQFDKLFLHNRQGSYKTKERYADAFRRFLRFWAKAAKLLGHGRDDVTRIYLTSLFDEEGNAF